MGTLQAKSKVGQGSTFTIEFELPMIVGEGVAVKMDECPIKGYEGGRKKILVVDDNFDNLLMLKSLLEPIGFKLDTANNGVNALKKITKNKFDLILLDLIMPVINGLDVVKKIKDDQKLKEIKIIGITAATLDKASARYFAETCNDFIFKPIEPYCLFEKIKEQLQVEWVFEEALINISDKQGTNYDEENIPSVKILNTIAQKVGDGDFNAIQDIINELYNENDAYRVFCDTLQKYIDYYDEISLITYINGLKKCN